MLRQDLKYSGAGANQMKPTVPRANAKPKVVVKPKVDVAAKKPVVKPRVGGEEENKKPARLVIKPKAQSRPVISPRKTDNTKD